MLEITENIIYTADSIYLSNGIEYHNTEFYFTDDFIVINNTWINKRIITRIVNITEKNG